MLRKKTFKQQHGMTRREAAILSAKPEEIVEEFNMIEQKRSRLPSNLRKLVIKEVERLAALGVVKINDANDSE